MPHFVRWLDEGLYPNHQDHWDDAEFRETILRHLSPSSEILELGAGAGVVKEMSFRGMASRVRGVDPDPRVLQNPHLDEACLGIGEALPYSDASFDLAFADNVLEHLENPAAVFSEIARALKPGGLFLVKTPNRYHYVSTLARILPQCVHRWYNYLRGRQVVDTFPKYYRANTRIDLLKHALSAGLILREVRLLEGRPEYLRLTVPTYLMGCAYERLVNSLASLENFRVVLIAIFEKPDAAPVVAQPAAERFREPLAVRWNQPAPV